MEGRLREKFKKGPRRARTYERADVEMSDENEDEEEDPAFQHMQHIETRLQLARDHKQKNSSFCHPSQG